MGSVPTPQRSDSASISRRPRPDSSSAGNEVPGWGAGRNGVGHLDAQGAVVRHREKREQEVAATHSTVGGGVRSEFGHDLLRGVGHLRGHAQLPR